MNMLYLIGEPGAGKSTLAATLTANAMSFVTRRPFAFTTWQRWPDSPEVVELGIARDAFSGTDALSMSVQPKVLDYLDVVRPGLVFGEGDRLSTTSFFTAVKALGYALRVAHLVLPSEVADARRLRRAAELGRKPQNDTWVQGRRTKVENLAAAFADDVISIDATSDPDVMVRQVMRNPVAAALLGKGIQDGVE